MRQTSAARPSTHEHRETGVFPAEAVGSLRRRWQEAACRFVLVVSIPPRALEMPYETRQHRVWRLPVRKHDVCGRRTLDPTQHVGVGGQRVRRKRWGNATDDDVRAALTRPVAIDERK